MNRTAGKGWFWTAKLKFSPLTTWNIFKIFIYDLYMIQVCGGGGEIPKHWSGWLWEESRFLFERWSAPSCWRGAVTTLKRNYGTVSSLCGEMCSSFYFKVWTAPIPETHKFKADGLNHFIFVPVFQIVIVLKYLNDIKL